MLTALTDFIGTLVSAEEAVAAAEESCKGITGAQKKMHRKKRSKTQKTH